MMITTHQNKRSKYKKLATLTVIVGLIYVMFFSPVKGFFTGAAHTVAQPVWHVRDAMANTFAPFTYFSARRDVYIENQDLQHQVTALVAKVADRDLLRRENSELKRLLGRNETEDRVLATVMAKPGRTPYDTMIIDVGERDSVSQGDKVVLENVLLGEIEEVLYTTSKVILYSSSGRESEVVIGDDALQAEAVGQGGGIFEILFPKDNDLSVGDTVYIPNIEPKVVGVIDTIESNPNDAFEKLIVRSYVNPYTISYVEVVR